jgi:hypothetical protein
MNNKEKILPFRRLGTTRGSSRKNIGRRETNLPFSKTFLKDSHHLENREWMMYGNKVQEKHPFSAGAVSETIITEIVPTKMEK